MSELRNFKYIGGKELIHISKKMVKPKFYRCVVKKGDVIGVKGDYDFYNNHNDWEEVKKEKKEKENK